MQISTLRKEPRFETNLIAIETSKSKKINGEIRDMSKQGCRFHTAPLSRPFVVSDYVSIQVQLSGGTSRKPLTLTGTIRNIQRTLHHYRYGVLFDEAGLESAKEVLGKLKFNGTKLIVK
jgi:hypothetical protein